MGNFVDIGIRLKNERERLGLSQSDFAALAEIGRKSQFNYETGERSPDAQYLAAISAAGADIGYIVTGIRHASGALNKDVIDWHLLEQVIAGVDEFLADRKAKLRADKKAGLIRVLYEKFSQDKELNQAKFKDFMDAVMATV